MPYGRNTSGAKHSRLRVQLIAGVTIALLVAVVVIAIVQRNALLTVVGVDAPGCAYADPAMRESGASPLVAPPEIKSVHGVLKTVLDVRYGDNVIGGCHVHLRSYDGRLTAPTLRAHPGDTLAITVKNDLPNLVDSAGITSSMGMKLDFNSTNLHTHGLHVSPKGNSDNAFVDIHPGHAFSYVIRIPKNHPTGTFLYHGHLHGSTAVQLSSGMAGALIVSGHGLDDVPEIKAAREQILVFQQISYNRIGHWRTSTRRFIPTPGGVGIG